MIESWHTKVSRCLTRIGQVEGGSLGENFSSLNLLEILLGHDGLSLSSEGLVVTPSDHRVIAHQNFATPESDRSGRRGALGENFSSLSLLQIWVPDNHPSLSSERLDLTPSDG